MNQQYTTDELIPLHQEVISMFKDLLVPFMEIQRDIPFAGKEKRPETDAEHVFSLSMIALSIEERLGLGLDRGLIAQYALIHDLVEAYAGDVSAKADEHLHAAKAIDEAKALQDISQKYTHVFPWIPRLCKAYEHKADAESKFVYAVDKLMGSYTWLAGELRYWQDYYPAEKPDLLNTTTSRLRNKVAAQNSEMLALFDTIHDILDQKVSNFPS